MNKPKMQMPCPFCASEKIDIKFGARHDAGNIGVAYCYAYCKTCLARGPIAEIRSFNGKTTITDERTKKYLADRAKFFFSHGYLDLNETNDWMLTKHGDIIRDDAAPTRF